MAGATLAATAIGLVTAATAWACVSGPAVLLNTDAVKAGETLQVKATNFTKPEPVIVRFNALDGPVLADLGTARSGNLEGSVTIPAGTAPGSYVLVFTQTKADGKPSQVPARALFTVTGESGAQPVVAAAATPASDPRIDSLFVADDGVSGTTLALIALGVGGLALFLAGIAALLASRRGDSPVMARVNS